MEIWNRFFTIDDLNRKYGDGLVQYLGIFFSDRGEDYLEASMVLKSHMMQPMGIMHGGISSFFAELLGSAAGNCCVDSSLYRCIGLDLNSNHLRMAMKGVVKGVAHPYHLGRRTQVWSIEIRNDEGDLISINRLTMLVVPIEKSAVC